MKITTRRDWRRRLKKYLVDCLGGKCRKCGYDNYLILTFHHMKKKKYAISVMVARHHPIKKILKELKKCILLCRNCHGELDLNLWSAKHLKIILNNEAKMDLLRLKLSLLKKKCFICKKIFFTKRKSQKVCSMKCSNISKRKVVRPSKMQLKKEIKVLSWTMLGQKYKVTGNAVKKWAEKYNIKGVSFNGRIFGLHPKDICSNQFTPTSGA